MSGVRARGPTAAGRVPCDGAPAQCPGMPGPTPPDFRLYHSNALDVLAALLAEEARMREVAIEAYSKPSEDNLLNLQSSDLNEAVRKQALLDIVGNATLDITERIKGLKAELEGR